MYCWVPGSKILSTLIRLTRKTWIWNSYDFIGEKKINKMQGGGLENGEEGRLGAKHDDIDMKMS